MNTTKTLPIPDLSDEQYLGAVCGLRPCRHGGLRLEIEQIENQSIVHNYGHGGCGVTTSFGSAQIASDLVKQIAKPSEHIAVLGAGIIGLTAARALLKQGYSVSIYADLVAQETTSALAGALWLPVGIDFGDTPEQRALMNDVLIRSHAEFRAIDPERYGIEDLPIYEPADSATEPYLFDNGTIAPPIKIDAFPFDSPAKPGRMFTTQFIHNHIFLSAIHEEVLALGARFHQHKFSSKDDLRGLDERVLVNCLALGSRTIFDDQQVYAARGVLVHMQPQDLGYGIHDGFKYMFPRSNALILGGCFREHDWDDKPDQAMIDEILNHHRRFFGQETHSKCK